MRTPVEDASDVSSVLSDDRWAGLRVRIFFALIVVVLALVGFSNGVGVTERDGLVEESFATHLYYAFGLFLLGGLEIGMPVGGEPPFRAMLWVAYFAAPIVAASTVVEAVLLAFRRNGLQLSDHVVIVGCDRLTRVYLRRLRSTDTVTPVLVLGAPEDTATLEDLRDRFTVNVLSGRLYSQITLQRLQLEYARRVLVLTPDDFTNFDIATRMIELHPPVESKIHIHVHDLAFARSVHRTEHPLLRTVFNGHAMAARELVQSRLLDHFVQTEEKDSVVLAGFGNFAQTVLYELQEQAIEQLARVVIVDTHARREAAAFKEQVGFDDRYQLDVIDGDIRYPETWTTVNTHIDLSEGEPVLLIGSGDDQANIRVALTLAERYDNVVTIARNERQWAFADSLSKMPNTKIEIVSVVQLVAQSLPKGWFGDECAAASAASVEPDLSGRG